MRHLASKELMVMVMKTLHYISHRENTFGELNWWTKFN